MTEVSLSPGGPITQLLTTWDEAVGRTIKSVTQETVDGCYVDILVFRFTDGSGLVLHGYDNEQYCGEPDPLSGNYDDDRRQRVHLGIDALGDYTRGEAERHAQYAAENEAYQRALFDKLKQKYGA